MNITLNHPNINYSKPHNPYNQEDPLALYELASYYLHGKRDNKTSGNNHIYKQPLKVRGAQKLSGVENEILAYDISYPYLEILAKSKEDEQYKKNLQKAYLLYEKSAGQNFLPGIIALGHCCRYGLGTLTNKKKALQCYKKAANQNNPEGYINLAYCYLYGEGTKVDLEKAFEHIKIAAESKHPQAQILLGLFYHYGCGTERDPIKADKAFKTVPLSAWRN